MRTKRRHYLSFIYEWSACARTPLTFLTSHDRFSYNLNSVGKCCVYERMNVFAFVFEQKKKRFYADTKPHLYDISNTVIWISCILVSGYFTCSFGRFVSICLRISFFSYDSDKRWACVMRLRLIKLLNVRASFVVSMKNTCELWFLCLLLLLLFALIFVFLFLLCLRLPYDSKCHFY